MRKSPLTVGSLFAGIGGFELGLERAGMDVAWHCEADPFCQRVLAKHWPGVPIFDDVCTLNAGMAEGVDVLCGGFPCQDISLAGKGAGIDGARSGLWSEYARLIGEFRPRYVVVENVSALLGRGLDRVLTDLSALGFDAEWDCIPASAVGAPHRRDRVWIVAYPSGVNGGSRGQGGLDSSSARQPQSIGALSRSDSDREGSQGRSVPSREREEVARVRNGCTLADSPRVVGRPGSTPQPRAELGGCCEGRGPDEGWTADNSLCGRHGAPQGEVRAGGHGTLDSGWWAVEPDVGRVAYGISARVDRLRSLGNALVPQIAEWIGQRIVAYEDSLDGVGVER